MAVRSMKAGEVVAGRYRLDARLGIGGMGEVWKATHEATSRVFAIKFMHAHAAASASARQRFTREARVSAKINHPNVIDIFDAGEFGEGTLYLAMELLDGISLADALHVAPPLSVRDLLIIMHDTARALSAAHAVGIVHRDIKPANIFLHRDRATGFASAKVLDFGISKFSALEDSNQTKTGAVLGSPRYMSPEQTRSAASVDQRADVWACGVILFEGFVGTWPHDGDSFSSLVVAICTVPPASIDALAPDLPEPVRAIVRDCLKPLGERIAGASELADRIVVALQDPALAQRPLARPLHPPSESIKASTGVRIRPLLTTTNSADTLRTTGTDTIPSAPESLRTTQQRVSRRPAGDRELDGGRPPPALAGRGTSDRHQVSAHSASRISRADDPADRDRDQPDPWPGHGAPQLPARAPSLAPTPPLRRPASGACAGPPQPAQLKPQARTTPLPEGMAMHAELIRKGLISSDSLTGTLETLATTTVRESVTAPPPLAAPAAPALGTRAAPLPRTSGLRLVAAGLSVLLLLIVVALVALLRSSTSGAAVTAASPAFPSASEDASAARRRLPPPPEPHRRRRARRHARDAPRRPRPPPRLRVSRATSAYTRRPRTNRAARR